MACFRTRLEEERKRLQNARFIIQKAWDIEVKYIEQGLKQDVKCHEFNPFIFPYHMSCYFLLDMHLCFREESFSYKMPFYIDPMARRNDDFVIEESYLPNSSFAVWFSLVPKYRTPMYSNRISPYIDYYKSDLQNPPQWIDDPENPLASDMSFLDEWMDRLQEELVRDDDEATVAQTIDADVIHLNNNFGIPTIESLNKGVRTKTLLKLLKHSMSDLQRDHRLATAVLLALVEYGCFEGEEGVEAFRYFLATLEHDYIYDCDGACYQREEEDISHVCQDWQRFVRVLSFIMHQGIKRHQEGHGILISTYIDNLLEKAGWRERKKLQDLVGWDPDEQENGEVTRHVDLICIMLQGLVQCISSERDRAFKLIHLKYGEKVARVAFDDKLKASMSRQRYLTRALVDVGRSVLIRCPANPTTENICSVIATGLLLASIGPPTIGGDIHRAGEYIGNHEHFRSIMDTSRYADMLTQACPRDILEQKINQFKRSCNIHPIHSLDDDDLVQSFFLATPSKDIEIVMKGLFLRQLIETRVSGFGYGDFLVWSGLSTMSPYELMLYEPNMNYPEVDDYEGDTPFVDEETGELLNKGEIRATYDMSLLLLRRAWRMPWTPETHSSFQRPFRLAVKTAALCAHRHGLPLELCLTVNSYLSRDWWQDDRTSCWLYECQIGELERQLHSLDENYEIVHKSKPLIRCMGCLVACACNRKHMKGVLHEGHTRCCKVPPMRVPTAEDIRFCSHYLEESRNDCLTLTTDDKSADANDGIDLSAFNDDEAGIYVEEDGNLEWESVASSIEETDKESKTKVIFKYFENNSYKVQRKEEHAFASFYTDD